MSIWVVMGLRPMRMVSGLRRRELERWYWPWGRKRVFDFSMAAWKAGRSSVLPSPVAPKDLMLAQVSMGGRGRMSDGGDGGRVVRGSVVQVWVMAAGWPRAGICRP